MGCDGIIFGPDMGVTNPTELVAGFESRSWPVTCAPYAE